MTHETDVELHERVAKIEARVEHIDRITSERKGRMQRIEDKIDSMERDLERYRGTVGAILLVLTAVTTFLKLFWQDMQRLFK